MVLSEELPHASVKHMDINLFLVKIEEELALIAMNNLVECIFSVGVPYRSLYEVGRSTEVGELFVGRGLNPHHDLVFLDVVCNFLALCLGLGFLREEFLALRFEAVENC
jgi:hypothetical protein